jgi:hypothetical protein
MTETSKDPINLIESYFESKIRLVHEINLRRQEMYNKVTGAVMHKFAEPRNFRQEFSYYVREGEQTCACGNVFLRKKSCEQCSNKCLDQDYEA